MSELRIRDYHDVILRPVVSEKNYNLLNKNKYTFIMAPHANKTEIKIAIEEISDVRVIAISAQNRQGKRRRTHFGIDGRVDAKRAIMTIAEGDYIDTLTDQGE